MRVVVILFCLIQYVYGGCLVTPDANGHVSAADLSATINTQTYKDRIYTYAFDACSGLESIEIPDHVKIIRYRAFSYTYNLKNITFLGDIESIEEQYNYGAFENSGRDVDTMSITFMGNVGTIERYGFYGAGENAIFMSVDFRKNVGKISDNAFYNSGVVSITYGGSKGTIESQAFTASQYERCRMDESTPGVNLDTGHGTYGGTSDSFSNCNSLTSVTIEDGIAEIGTNAFKNTRLTSVTIPDSVSKIGSSAFYYTPLTSVTIPSSVIEIGQWAFYGSDVVSVTYNGNLPSFGSNVFKYSQYEKCRMDEDPPGMNLTTGHGKYNGTSDSFYGCKHLTSVTIPDSVETIGGNAFRETALTSVTIPSSVTSIGSSAFERSALTSVTIPSSMTEIGGNAFYSTALTSINLPNSVTTLGINAFPPAVFVKQYYTLQNTSVSTILNSFSLQELKDNYRSRSGCSN